MLKLPFREYILISLSLSLSPPPPLSYSFGFILIVLTSFSNMVLLKLILEEPMQPVSTAFAFKIAQMNKLK